MFNHIKTRFKYCQLRRELKNKKWKELKTAKIAFNLARFEEIVHHQYFNLSLMWYNKYAGIDIYNGKHGWFYCLTGIRYPLITTNV